MGRRQGVCPVIPVFLDPCNYLEIKEDKWARNVQTKYCKDELH